MTTTLSDLPNDVLPIIALCMSRRLVEVDDLMIDCANLAMCGNSTTSRLATHLGCEVNIRSQISPTVPDGCLPSKPVNKTELVKLSKAAGINCKGATAVQLRNHLSYEQRSVGDHCFVQVCAALHIMNLRVRRMPVYCAQILYSNCDLSGCQIVSNTYRYSDLRRSPPKVVDHLHMDQRNALSSVHQKFIDHQLSKPWYVRTDEDCSYAIKRVMLKRCVLGQDVPEDWCETYQFYECLNTLVAEDGTNDNMDVEDLQPTRSLLETLRTIKAALVYMSIDPWDMDAFRTDLETLARSQIEARIMKPACFAMAADAVLADASVASIRALDERIVAAWADYRHAESAFANTWLWTWQLACSLPGHSMGSVVAHIKAFNTLLMEVSSYGWHVDDEVFRISISVYLAPYIDDMEMLNNVLFVLWAVRIVPDYRTPCNIIGHANAIVSVLSHIWRGKFPSDTPPRVLTRVQAGTGKYTLKIRKYRTAKDARPVALGDLLLAVQELIDSSMDMNYITVLMYFKNSLVCCITDTHEQWLRSNDMTITFGALHGFSEFLSRDGNQVSDVPNDIISLARV